MKNDVKKPLKQLLRDVAADGVVDAAEVAVLRKRLYADGKIDREEADFLFALNDAVGNAKNAPGWRRLFVAALTDFVLGDKASAGEVDDMEAAYLIRKIRGNRVVDAAELALLVNISARAKATPPRFQRFVLASLKEAILRDGVVDADEVKMIRAVIYGGGGSGGAAVSRAEADFLFEINDVVSGKRNAPAWKRLFVDAITKHILGDDSSPGTVDDGEAKYLNVKIGADGKVDEVELALLKTIRKRAHKVSEKLRQ